MWLFFFFVYKRRFWSSLFRPPPPSSISMASHHQSEAQVKLTVSTSPKSDGGNGDVAASCPKGQCLCSPTTHEGSFRCRFHRSGASSSSAPPTWMKRTKSMSAAGAANNKVVFSISPQWLVLWCSSCDCLWCFSIFNYFRVHLMNRN